MTLSCLFFVVLAEYKYYVFIDSVKTAPCQHYHLLAHLAARYCSSRVGHNVTNYGKAPHLTCAQHGLSPAPAVRHRVASGQHIPRPDERYCRYLARFGGQHAGIARNRCNVR